MSDATLEVGGRQPAWQIARLCVATSLHYDARVNAAESTEPYALRVRVGLVEALAASAGCVIDEVHLAQVFTARSLAGFQVDDPTAVLPRARVAHVIERGPELRQALREIAPTASNPEISEAEAMDDCSRCVALWCDQGVSVFQARVEPQQLVTPAVPG